MESRDGHIFLQADRRFKDRPQSIKIGLTHGIVFVIVALSTSDLQAENHFTDRGRHFVQQCMSPFVL